MAVKEDEEPEGEVEMVPSGEALRPLDNDTHLMQFSVILRKWMYYGNSTFLSSTNRGSSQRGDDETEESTT